MNKFVLLNEISNAKREVRSARAAQNRCEAGRRERIAQWIDAVETNELYKLNSPGEAASVIYLFDAEDVARWRQSLDKARSELRRAKLE